MARYHDPEVRIHLFLYPCSSAALESPPPFGFVCFHILLPITPCSVIKPSCKEQQQTQLNAFPHFCIVEQVGTFTAFSDRRVNASFVDGCLIRLSGSWRECDAVTLKAEQIKARTREAHARLTDTLFLYLYQIIHNT